MKPFSLSRTLPVGMAALGLLGTIYSAVQWKLAPSSSAVKYEILLLMWLVLGIGWGSRLLPNGSRQPGGADHTR